MFEKLGLDTSKKKKKKKNKNKNKQPQDDTSTFVVKEPPSVKDGWEVVEKKKKSARKQRDEIDDLIEEFRIADLKKAQQQTKKKGGK